MFDVWKKYRVDIFISADCQRRLYCIAAPCNSFAQVQKKGRRAPAGDGNPRVSGTPAGGVAGTDGIGGGFIAGLVNAEGLAIGIVELIAGGRDRKNIGIGGDDRSRRQGVISVLREGYQRRSAAGS